MKQNFKISVPEGCTADIKQENGLLVVTFGPEKWEPKDGDVIAFGIFGIGIFKGYDSIGHKEYVTYVDELHFNETGWVNDNMRPATEEEKQRLFDALAKEGKRWNAEEKRIEDLSRWRAAKDGFYYYIDPLGIVNNDTDISTLCDKERYDVGNYFKTLEAAEKVACQIREIFKNSKAE